MKPCSFKCRRAKRRAQQRVDVGSDKEEEDSTSVAKPPETEAHGQTDSDIEAKLATVEDQKEAKRLKRSAPSALVKNLW